MLGVGQKFPHFKLTGVVSNDIATAFQTFDQDSSKGKWKVVFFWPKDFTFVCPTEIAAFGKLNREFNDRDAVVYGVPVPRPVRGAQLALSHWPGPKVSGAGLSYNMAAVRMGGSGSLGRFISDMRKRCSKPTLRA